ncbi:DUF2933 domain-containing protein [Robertmurraya massiliosenegalensis]|uniref:DUF2933 domain-containing protein n=1 Tax=Robertmurraya TaxID=2837507 RepID=UPI0039A68643
MEWLLLLICPLMMIFMMKGHSHGGHKRHNTSKEIDSKMSLLEKENERLQEEINNLSSMIKKS